MFMDTCVPKLWKKKRIFIILPFQCFYRNADTQQHLQLRLDLKTFSDQSQPTNGDSNKRASC